MATAVETMPRIYQTDKTKHTIEYRSKWYRVHKEKNPEQYLIYSARKRAKIKKLEFSITEVDIVIPVLCPILQIPLQRVHKIKGSNRDAWPTLDRIDNSKGYTKDNIQVISFKANTMKNNASFSELKLFSEYIQRQLCSS